MGDDNGGSERRRHFKTVLLCPVGPLAAAFQGFQELARVVVLFGAEAALEFGQRGGKVRQEDGGKYAPVSNGHQVLLGLFKTAGAKRQGDAVLATIAMQAWLLQGKGSASGGGFVS